MPEDTADELAQEVGEVAKLAPTLSLWSIATTAATVQRARKGSLMSASAPSKPKPPSTAFEPGASSGHTGALRSCLATVVDVNTTRRAEKRRRVAEALEALRRDALPDLAAHEKELEEFNEKGDLYLEEIAEIVQGPSAWTLPRRPVHTASAHAMKK